MNRYKMMVKRLADSKSSELIPNGGTEHAEVLIENIFSHANNVVRIFSGELNARVYGSSVVIDQAKDFLQSGAGKKIKILVQELDDASLQLLKMHELVKMCREINADACEIKSVDERDKEVGSHFVIMDDQGYRLEPDRSKPTGIGCFNDDKTAAQLSKIYDDMFSRGKDVPLN